MAASSLTRSTQLPSERMAFEQVAAALGVWSLDPEDPVEMDLQSSTIQVGPRIFRIVLQFRLSADFFEHWTHSRPTSTHPDAIPLLVVLYMTPASRAKCEKAGISWLDLSGNADISAPGLRVFIEGKPNRFRRPGRVATAFAPKGARVARYLLEHPGQYLSQSEIVDQTKTSRGHVSKVVSKLLAQGLITKADEGKIRVPHPDRLLDAWVEEYDFDQHARVSCILASRVGQETTAKLAERLNALGLDYAATGLSAAYLLDPFANYRIATFFVDSPLTDELLSQLDLREAERGGNIWLVSPNDHGVFQGVETYEEIPCAHPVQVYLDLLGHPERAKEAAEHLRQHRLNWRDDAN